jgi:hypothetical protein
MEKNKAFGNIKRLHFSPGFPGKKVPCGFPAFEHDGKIGVVVFQGFAPHELQHLLVGEITDDDGYGGALA